MGRRVVPFDAPILEKPEINIEDIPLLPPAPVLDKPELVIDIPEPKQDKPKPQPKEDKPNTPAPKETPKVEEVKITNRVENHAQNTRNEYEETVEAYSAPATLPNTGSDFRNRDQSYRPPWIEPRSRWNCSKERKLKGIGD